MTYRETLKNCRDLLTEAGITDAEIDARLILQHVTGQGRSYLLAHADEELSEREERLYELLSERRASHIPLQHLMGYTEFMGLNFLVSKEVLIPRIDTEFLVEEAMRYIGDGSKVLDLCTGSGCIILSLMRYKNDIEGTGADISDAAIENARQNAEKLGLSDVTFIKSDMFSNITGTFDYILCNPPYIKTAVIPTLMEEVRLFEPHIALDGGADGLDFYRILADKAKNYLRRGGKAFLEIGFDEGDEVKKLFLNSGYKQVELVKDYAGLNRVIIADYV